MTRSISLKNLADGLFDISAQPDIEIEGLCVDSRLLQPGDAFMAIQGLSAHGLQYLSSEQAASAAVILYDTPVPDSITIPENAIAVPGLLALQASIANRFFGEPSKSLRMIGVTGTNGKTSTVQMIAQALALQEKTVGTIGTLGVGLYGNLKAGERTTPDVVAVHRALAEMRDAGAVAVAMEVSSHALDQGRVAQVSFDTVVFSNLTLDHLDYHGSMANYFAAKARLFKWPGLKHAVINVDDAYGRQLLSVVDKDVQVIRTSSCTAHADLCALEPVLGLPGMQFTLGYQQQQAQVISPLLGRFNVDNLLAVAGVLLADGMALGDVAELLGALQPVDGRMRRLGGTQGKPLVVVDYAHTPDALEQALKTLRGHSQGRLICVFGCGGDRDRSKRPLMAAAAELWADLIWVTDDNPRTESGDAILDEIRTGFRQPAAVHFQRDRKTAIAQAIAAAEANDIVLIAGKGHETYQEVGGVKAPFDDSMEAANCLQVAA